MMENSKSVFAYGSLVLPTSLIARFDERISKIDPVYQSRKRYKEEGILRESAVQLWNDEYSNRLNVYPAKIPEYVKTYTYDSPRGGAMLDAQYTGDENDWINGLIYTGLTSSEYDGVTSTEKGYTQKQISKSNIDFYADDVKIQNSPRIYSVDQNSLKILPNKSRNDTYHSRILEGIDFLSEIYNRDVRDEFLSDFLDTTYEFPSVELDD